MKNDSESKTVAEFLQALMQAHESLSELAGQVRSRSEVKSVKVCPFIPTDMTQHHWDEEQQEKAVGAEFGVSAELYDGAILDWWLQVRCQQSGWYITANIFRGDAGEDGCHRVAEYDEQHSLTFAAALTQLSESVGWLVANAGMSQLFLSHGP